MSYRNVSKITQQVHTFYVKSTINTYNIFMPFYQLNSILAATYGELQILHDDDDDDELMY